MNILTEIGIFNESNLYESIIFTFEAAGFASFEDFLDFTDLDDFKDFLDLEILEIFFCTENLDDFLDSLTTSQKNALHRWMNVDDDHSYIKKIKNDIKLLLYNKRKMPLNRKLEYIEVIDDIEVIDYDMIELDKLDVKVIKIPKDVNIKIKRKTKKCAGRPGTKRKIVKTIQRNL